jgi:arylsulfatase A-like enzyme
MAPLRGYKGTYYEGGIREPFFVRWPGVVPAGVVTAEPMIGVDIYPTFCEIAGATLSDQPLDGISLLPLLKGQQKTLPQRDLFWHFPAYLQAHGVEGRESRDPLFRTRPCSVIRSGDWKLHHFFEDDGVELYNLHEDLGEARNLAAEMPAKVAELRGRLDTWRNSVRAPIPTEPNPEFDAEAERTAIETARQRKRRELRTPD